MFVILYILINILFGLCIKQKNSEKVIKCHSIVLQEKYYVSLLTHGIIMLYYATGIQIQAQPVQWFNNNSFRTTTITFVLSVSQIVEDSLSISGREV